MSRPRQGGASFERYGTWRAAGCAAIEGWKKKVGGAELAGRIAQTKLRADVARTEQNKKLTMMLEEL
jgi:hypothetical protein